MAVFRIGPGWILVGVGVLCTGLMQGCGTFEGEEGYNEQITDNQWMHADLPAHDKWYPMFKA